VLLPFQYVPLNVGLPLFAALPQPTVGVMVWFTDAVLATLQVGLLKAMVPQAVEPATVTPPHITFDTVIWLLLAP